MILTNSQHQPSKDRLILFNDLQQAKERAMDPVQIKKESLFTFAAIYCIVKGTMQMLNQGKLDNRTDVMIFNSINKEADAVSKGEK